MAHKLLIADGSATIQRVVELTFSGEDVQIITAGDGDDAIARIQSERPDVVLADIGMPKRNGYDVAAFVKERADLRHIPVLLLAGAFEPVDEQRARQVSSDGVLVKPFEPQQLIARVRELLDGTRPKSAPQAAPVGEPVERQATPPPLEFPRREEPRAAPAATMVSPTPAPQFAPDPDPRSDSAGVDDPSFAPEPSHDLDVDTFQSSAPGESLDEYFDRLDAAFTTFEVSPPPKERPRAQADGRHDVPTLDALIAQPSPAPPTSGNVVADAFIALLAVEAGEPGARPVRLTTVGDGPQMTEALMEDLTRRVVERLAPGAVRDAVADIVSEVAERLVREEIERVRNRP